jgi:dienelactone hydrolase
VSETIGVILVAMAVVSACADQPQRPAPRPSRPSRREVAQARPTARTLGTLGTYRVGTRQMTFVDPAHAGPAGQHLGPRRLVTVIRYPSPRRPAAARSAVGPFPLVVFAPGFMQCSGPYAHLLRAWVSAGYVVAAVDFPRTDCHVGAAAVEADLVNQPHDLSYVISRLLALSAHPHDLLSGLLNRHQIAAAGQSDGGDTVAALANTCCADRRLVAVAVLSGAEWPPMPGRYFAHRSPPMLFVQGSADTTNPPWMSRQLYRADSSRARYYLALFGADHTVPYWGTNRVERLVARVTLAFLDRFVLGQSRALATMRRSGNVRGKAVLVSGRRPPP